MERTYCGKHIILEVWTAKDEPALGSVETIRDAFLTAAETCGATVLGHNWHHFGEGCGVTGVVMLSESHMSIHTWPEYGYAAVDVFMCGDCDPANAIDDIVQGLNAYSFEYSELSRGQVR